MAIELRIDGYFEMTIYNYQTGERVDEKTEKGVLKKLQNGEHIIGIDSKTIVDINQIQTPIYKFSIDPAKSGAEYEFDEWES